MGGDSNVSSISILTSMGLGGVQHLPTPVWCWLGGFGIVGVGVFLFLFVGVNRGGIPAHGSAALLQNAIV